MRRPLAAVTGGSGFVGRHVAQTLAARGWRVRLLVRQQPPASVSAGDEPELVFGSLEDDAALRQLVTGANVIVHAAGLIKARTDREYFRINALGSERLARTVREHAAGSRLVVISSIAAREPQLSGYAASKRAGEDAALSACGMNSVVVLRPTAIYGPGDRETLRVFQAARASFIIVPAGDNKLSLIHVSDFAEAVAAVAADHELRGTFEVTDEHWGGYSWNEIVAAVATALGCTPRILRIPRSILRGLAPAFHIARLVRAATMLTPGKVREILHDWSSSPSAQLPRTAWSPKISLDTGFSETVRWYVQNGWMTPMAGLR